MKKIFLIALPLLILGYFFLGFKEDSQEFNPEDNSLQENFKTQENKGHNQVPLSEAEKKSDDSEEEAQLKELGAQWHQELKTHLKEIDPENAEEIFSRYLSAVNEHIELSRDLYQVRLEYLDRSKTTSLSLIEKKEFITLDKKIDTIQNEYRMQVKNILGDHFESVQKKYNLFIEDVESYQLGTNKGELSEDHAFTER